MQEFDAKLQYLRKSKESVYLEKESLHFNYLN